jgi:murein L,D-transpeptidase YcbB/YkuD
VLLEAIADSESHGLLPSDSHREALASRLATAGTRGPAFGRDAELELLLSDAFLRLAYTLHFGKLDPMDTHPEWNFERSLTPEGSLAAIEYALSRGDISGFLARVAPQGPIYTGMRSALARYRELAAGGRWPSVPPGDTLEEGSRGPRVAALRARLEVIDPQLSKQVADRELFDADLADAVRRFQAAHGLDVDAKVGPGTVAALNVTAAERVDQLRANLERVRWVFPGIGDDFLVVNIAWCADDSWCGRPVSRSARGTTRRRCSVTRSPTWCSTRRGRFRRASSATRRCRRSATTPPTSPRRT